MKTMMFRLSSLGMIACIIATFILSACSPTPTATQINATPFETSPQATAEFTATFVPTPSNTATPAPSATPTITPTRTETPVPPTPTPDIGAFKNTAQILVYTDGLTTQDFLSGTAPVNYVIQALEQAGYHFVDTTGRVGDLKNELSNKQWDLILVSAEDRASVRGEFFAQLRTQLKGGAVIVLESWIFDKDDDFSTLFLLDDCGIRVQDDYTDSHGRAISWSQPDHPLLTVPHSNIDLTRSINFWSDDIGDLIELAPGSSATILGSLNGSTRDQGVLTVCHDNRLILQTFSTHDHHQEDMIKLWQNYAYYGLQQRLNYINQLVVREPALETLEAQYASAQILAWGSAGIPALTELGLPFETATGPHDFTKAIGRQSWDLILVGANLGGDMFPLLTLAKNQGASIILSNMELDTIPYYYLEPFMTQCGLQLQGPFTNGLQERMHNQTSHQLFQKPNQISETPFQIALMKNNMGALIPADWPVGLLWRQTGEQPATLLTSLDGSQAEGGAIALCSDQQMLVMTVYDRDFLLVEKLFENVITFMLEINYLDQ